MHIGDHGTCHRFRSMAARCDGTAIRRGRAGEQPGIAAARGTQWATSSQAPRSSSVAITNNGSSARFGPIRSWKAALDYAHFNDRAFGKWWTEAMHRGLSRSRGSSSRTLRQQPDRPCIGGNASQTDADWQPVRDGPCGTWILAKQYATGRVIRVWWPAAATCMTNPTRATRTRTGADRGAE